MRQLYTLGVHLFYWLIRLAAWFNPKAKAWVTGRKQLFPQLERAIQSPIDVWIHCASLGEFEQGRPLIEALRKRYPEKQLLLTFFSPSGYEIRKAYKEVNHVFYLPMDTPKQVQRFLNVVQPRLVIFVKYEFWQNYLYALQDRTIPTVLISAIFHKKQPFFQWYAPLFRPVLDCFTQLFVQNERSAKLLEEIGISSFQIAGDTRVDRVLAIAKTAEQFPIIEQFQESKPTLIAGSTWPPDEAILTNYINANKTKDWKYIFAPHDISESHITQLIERFEVPVLRYTEIEQGTDITNSKVLIVDTIGMLSQLYQYGKIAYIGGGFGAGIHNTLEPIAFGLPVLFGPKYTKFEEAIQLVEHDGGFVIETQKDFEAQFQVLQTVNNYKKASNATSRYIRENKGATKQILNYLKSIL